MGYDKSITFAQDTLTLKDEDTGTVHHTFIKIRPHAPGCVQVTFGNSFSFELQGGDMLGFVDLLKRVADEAMNNANVIWKLENEGE